MAAVLDGHCTLYDVLQAKEDATVDEIKAAFKRRALEVHPDKGGSKEAFHRVYQALETLSDAKARQKYDDQLRKAGQLGGSVPKVPAKATPNGGAAQAKTSGPCSAPSKSGGSSAGGVEQAAGYKARLMTKIHSLLKQMPRDVRYKVISEEFSQKQRVLLQKWMAEFAEREAVPVDPQESLRKSRAKPGQKRCKTSKRTISGTRGVVSARSCYMATVFWDGMQICSRYSDLATALEYLVVLTSTKHKMQDRTQWQGTFEEYLEQALTASAAEHGRTLEELKVRFRVILFAGMFIGDNQVASPIVHSFESLGKLRQCMEPVRALRKQNTGNLFKSISPSEFQECWEQLQQVVAGMFQLAGHDTKQPLHRIRTWYEAHRHVRTKYLQQWEGHSMARHDKTKHVPQYLKYRLWRNPLTDNLQLLKSLLVRWQNVLQKEAHDLEKQRRQVAQQRKREREAQREARWKRMHDPNLTMDDILGPPKQPAEPDKRTLDWGPTCCLKLERLLFPEKHV